MRTVATLFQNSLIGPQAKAVYATMVKMGPSLISESRSLADEVNTILEDGRFPSADAWGSLLRRAQSVSAKFDSLHEELHGQQLINPEDG
jgi:hypothetical protein